jgi:rhodanese-related sulfurtransferase
MKKHLIIIVCIFLAIFGFVFTASTENSIPTTNTNNKTNPTMVSINELEQMFENKDFALIDLNIKEKKHIPDTDYMVPYNEYQFMEDFLKQDYERKIVLYDRDGTQSSQTANELVKRGYKNVYYLEGGSLAWASAGKTITSDMNTMGMGDMSMMHNMFQLESFIEIQKGINLVIVGNVSMQEISAHNTLEDCWVAVDGKVYNLPYYWTQMHPGGQDIYNYVCGTDISEMFKSHTTEKPSIILQYFYIGELSN